MSKEFTCGDHVLWNSEGGRARAVITGKLTSDAFVEGHTQFHGRC